MKKLLPLLVVVAALVASTAATAPAQPRQGGDIVQTAVSAGQFKTLASLLTKAGLVGALEKPGPYTVFAPTNEAFEKFSTASMDALLHGDEALLRAVIGYHFASGKVMSASFNGRRIRAVMYAGGDLIIDGKDGLRVNRANLVKPDIIAGACVIHGIDAVLWPREPAAARL